MKKKLFIIYFLIFGALPGFALAQGDLKVYYTEPLGAGEKVYHIESCKKTPAYGILRCSKETQSIAPKQCEADAEGKIPNIPIKGCVKDSEAVGEYVDFAKNYKRVYPKLMQAEGEGTTENPGCSNKPEKQGNYYAKIWGVVNQNGSDNPLEWTKLNTNVVAENEEQAKNILKEDNFSTSGTWNVAQLFNATLCAKFDVVDKTGEVQPLDELDVSEPKGPLTKFVTAQKSKLNKNNVVANCNTDNSISTDIPNFPVSTPFNNFDTYTCSIKERITGQTGAEIFGKYVSGIYKWAASIVGIVAVLTMVWGGVQISMAGGDEGKVGNAKTLITKSLIGLAILFLSGLILYTINPGFFVG